MPVKLLDLFLFRITPAIDSKKDWSPLQSANFFLILCFITLFFINYTENKGFNIAVLCFVFIYTIAIVYSLKLDNKYLFYALGACIVPIIAVLNIFSSIFSKIIKFINIDAVFYVIIILAWAKWVFMYVISIFEPSAPPPTWPILILHGLHVLIRLIISVALVPLAIFFVICYLLFYSFFGIFAFEKNGWDALYGILPFMRRKDKEFYSLHKLDFLQYLNNFIYGRFIWVAYIVLCLFYLFKIQGGILSFNLKSTLSLFLLLMVSMFVSILYLFSLSSLSLRYLFDI
jgi:hypothetical protein